MNTVATVDFNETPYLPRIGTPLSLAWGFLLTNSAREILGPVVGVEILSASVNGTPIQSPYAEHIEEVEPLNYNFHASLKNYNIIGGGKGTLRRGDDVNLVWYIFGDDEENAYRYINCTA